MILWKKGSTLSWEGSPEMVAKREKKLVEYRRKKPPRVEPSDIEKRMRRSETVQRGLETGFNYSENNTALPSLFVRPLGWVFLVRDYPYIFRPLLTQSALAKRPTSLFASRYTAIFCLPSVYVRNDIDRTWLYPVDNFFYSVCYFSSIAATPGSALAVSIKILFYNRTPRKPMLTNSDPPVISQRLTILNVVVPDKWTMKIRIVTKIEKKGRKKISNCRSFCSALIVKKVPAV